MSTSTGAAKGIEAIRQAVREALNRGDVQIAAADEGDLLELVSSQMLEDATISSGLFGLQLDQAPSPSISGRLTLSENLGLSPTLVFIRDEIEAYRMDVREEFESKTMKSLQDAFENERNKQQSHLDYYFEIRPDYYNAGYRKPIEELFKDIVQGGAATILGHKVVGGLHSKFLEKVSGLGRELEGIRPGLAEETKAEFTSIGGFNPRHSKGLNQSKLSNHAFGMAIDVNSKFTPQLKDKEVISILNAIVGQKDFDFGAAVLNVKKGEDIPDMDRIVEIHNRYQQASENVRQWLNKYLPAYHAYKAKKDKKEICAPDENLRSLETLVNRVGLGETEKWARKGIQSILSISLWQ